MRKFGLLSTVALLFATVTTGPALAGEYVLFYHNDALGSPVAVTDINGNIVWRADYEPFGNLATLAETLPNTHQFLGKEVDAETSLHYLEARFYDGSLGRFLSVDPLLLRGRPDSALKIPQRLNVYSYSTNNPYRFVDPDGKLTIEIFGGPGSSGPNGPSEGISAPNEGMRILRENIVGSRGGERVERLNSGQYQEAINLARDAASKGERINLVGHSLGAETAVHVARALDKLNIRVNLLATIDQVSLFGPGGSIPPNVNFNLSFWQNTWWFPHDGPNLFQQLQGVNIFVEGVNHFNITKSPIVENTIREFILRTR